MKYIVSALIILRTALAANHEVPTEVCTPLNVTFDCLHSECASYVPGTCYEITELRQTIQKPDMRACYGENYKNLYEAALLWNERPGRGIPAIAYAESVGTIEAKHMQIDIALMFDHWDIIARKVEEILAIDPNDPHALFAKVMYGFEDVLPGVSSDEIPALIEHMQEVAPNTAKMVDRGLADVKMMWFKEFTHPLYADSAELCGIGMDSDNLAPLFPGFSCEPIPEQYNPSDLAILVFGANHPVLLDARIKSARTLADRYPNAVILATGAAMTTEKAEGDLIKEAMPEYAERIVVDRTARDTIGNSLAIAEYLKENDIGNLLVVSSTFHLPRATMALRGVLQRMDMHPRSYLVGAGNNLQAELGNWSKDNADWLETAYGGGGRFRAIEIPMTNRDFARGAGLFTMCDFMELEVHGDDEKSEDDHEEEDMHNKEEHDHDHNSNSDATVKVVECKEASGLSSGAVAGIVIGVSVGLSLLTFFVTQSMFAAKGNGQESPK